MNSLIAVLLAACVGGCVVQQKCFEFGGGPFEVKNVCLDDFSIDDSLVTRKRYENITKRHIRNDSCISDRIGEYVDLNYTVEDSLLKPENPVVCVNYSEAEKYCRLVGGRLPTEEEWEYVAKNYNSFNGRKIAQMKNVVFQWTSTNEQELIKDNYSGLLLSVGSKNDQIKYQKGGCAKCDPLLSEPYMKSPFHVTMRSQRGGFRCVYDK